MHLAWRRKKEELRELPFPMLSNIQRNLSQQLGILNKNEGAAKRTTFIFDPKQTVQFIMVNDLNVGHNPHEVLTGT